MDQHGGEIIAHASDDGAPALGILGRYHDVAQRTQHQRRRPACARRRDQRFELEPECPPAKRKRLNDDGIRMRCVKGVE